MRSQRVISRSAALLFASLVVLHLLAQSLAADDLVDDVLARQDHRWRQVRQSGQERSRGGSGVLLHQHAALLAGAVTLRVTPTYSMTTSAAIVSTIGTARGTTHGSCRPFVARTPVEPSYLAVF